MILTVRTILRCEMSRELFQRQSWFTVNTCFTKSGMFSIILKAASMARTASVLRKCVLAGLADSHLHYQLALFRDRARTCQLQPPRGICVALGSTKAKTWLPSHEVRSCFWYTSHVESQPIVAISLSSGLTPHPRNFRTLEKAFLPQMKCE